MLLSGSALSQGWLAEPLRQAGDPLDLRITWDGHFVPYGTMRQLRACGFLIVRGEPIQEFLLMIHPDRLDLPKGHAEPGESDLACALRELQEETGIAAADIEIDPEFRFTIDYPVWPQRLNGEACHKTVVIFLAHLRRDVAITTSEHDGWQWYAWNPPHRLQKETIDPLLEQLALFLGRR